MPEFKTDGELTRYDPAHKMMRNGAGQTILIK